MAEILLVTRAMSLSVDVLPALTLLTHKVKVVQPDIAQLLGAKSSDLLFIDGRRDLAAARSFCRLVRTSGIDNAMLLIATEGGLAAVASDWGLDDVIIDTAGPAEVDARVRLAVGRFAAMSATSGENVTEEIRQGDLVVDESTYTARLHGRALDLTFKEFELLKYLAAHPGRVFSRAQLLQEVWGYDYYGGTRTVDVHVRRLRAKLGDAEGMIGTVRNVGYRFETEKTRSATESVNA